MKLSCLPVSYYPAILEGKMTVEDWAREASEIGLDAIDLSVLFLKNLDVFELSNMRKEIERHNIFVLMIATYPDFTHPDPLIRKKELIEMENHIRASAIVGAKMIRVTAGQSRPETGRDEGISWAIEAFKSIIDPAESARIKLLYENHSKPRVWDYSDFSHSSDIFLEISEGLNNTPIGILFDTANPIAYGEDVLPLLQKIIGRVECIHAADTSARGCLEPALLGRGLVPFDEIFRFLKRSGFDGWISIEEASSQGNEGVKAAVQFVRKRWADTEI